ncbi:prolyl oligopeptidase family serine peptidase [Leptolyngbya sp. 7M]|uniref:S9 family peptidase n=1 Tax=Leptolyngbya sp. 7M TaxID=2812896 RepID=UPI001B8B97FA|nr:prolyl oligopeptidase family serine peptidase [Leptolyngbya sp. 7M]QYO65226.1 prolyl oligopeptidase family serine peptidase [Leptolyngbya sp. 7M]
MRIRSLVFFVIVLLLPIAALSQGGYKQPPKAVMDVLNAPANPTTSVSPARDKIALFEPLRYPPISELARPMLRLAGSRIDPTRNSQHRQPYSLSLTLRSIADGTEKRVPLPAGAKLVSPQWSPDGKFIAVGNLTDDGVELWLIDTVLATARKVNGVKINTAFGGFDWESNTLISALIVPAGRGPAPEYRDVVPTEPNIQETAGRTGAVATFQDLLRSPNDERLFEYFATSQLVTINVNGNVDRIGQPAIYDNADLSPDGRYVLVSRINRPYSYQFPASRFPRKVEVWDVSGRSIKTIVEMPLQDNLPVQGVPVGPRGVSWVPTEPAMLMWTEALDGGDPRKKVSPRDKVMKLSAPFGGDAVEVVKTEHRYQGRSFGERDGMMWFFDFDRDTRKRRVFMTDYRDPKNVKLIDDRNVSDRYNDIGNPVMRTLPSGGSVIRQHGDEIFLSGMGASPQGDRPFFRAMNLKTLETREIFRAGTEEFETFVAMLDNDGMSFITRKESPTEPPNLYLRQVCPPGRVCTALAYRAITEFKDPTPQLREIKRQIVRYKRSDGVDLSFTLYLPPGYKEGTRLPTVVWAYPLEFTDAAVAGQVSGSENRFTQMGGSSHLFFLLQGYAVLDDATMPIVGDPETVNDTFVKQIVDSAKAAIDKGVEMGVVDPERVGVGGHSYGAFMTANLLAHSDLFRAGIARSGAYNRTLTPFGFQSERRTFWEAPDLYAKVSPFFFANKINEPILLIHGEVDNNQGTFPMQSERLYAAISGNGGIARLVMLPLESHGYAAKESIEHTLYEMIEWFDRHVKNVRPRGETRVSGN